MYVLRDCYMFAAFQVAILLVFGWCSTFSLRHKVKLKLTTPRYGPSVSGEAIVIREPKSLNILYGLYGATAFIVVTIDGYGGDFRIFFTLLNVVMLIYLFFFNAYFRNRAIGFAIRAENFVERM
jgi:hypothetical protein